MTLKKPHQILWISFLIFMFLYAVGMESQNFIQDPRGISVKIFEAILELGGVLFALLITAHIIGVYQVVRKHNTGES